MFNLFPHVPLPQSKFGDSSMWGSAKPQLMLGDSAASPVKLAASKGTSVKIGHHTTATLKFGDGYGNILTLVAALAGGSVFATGMLAVRLAIWHFMQIRDAKVSF